MVSSPDANSNTAIMKHMPNGFLTTIEVEPVGRWFLSHWERLNCGRGLSISGNDASELSESESDESEAEDDSFEDDIIFLRSLDPKESKDQDHYKVLGISKLRYQATDEQIKKAYRFKVLRHHPDKRRALGEDIREDDDYFTCITKAFETLVFHLKEEHMILWIRNLMIMFQISYPQRSIRKKSFLRHFRRYLQKMLDGPQGLQYRN